MPKETRQSRFGSGQTSSQNMSDTVQNTRLQRQIQEQPPKKNRKKWGWILVLVLFLLVGGGAYWFLSQPVKTTEQPVVKSVKGPAVSTLGFVLNGKGNTDSQVELPNTIKEWKSEVTKSFVDQLNQQKLADSVVLDQVNYNKSEAVNDLAEDYANFVFTHSKFDVQNYQKDDKTSVTIDFNLTPIRLNEQIKSVQKQIDDMLADDEDYADLKEDERLLVVYSMMHHQWQQTPVVQDLYGSIKQLKLTFKVKSEQLVVDKSSINKIFNQNLVE